MKQHRIWRLTLDTNPEDCNLSCIMCEEHSPFSSYIQEKLSGKHRRLPKEWLEPIFRQAKAMGIREILPSTMGEPLIYRHFEDFVELCYKYDIKMNLTTNGTFPKISKKSVVQWAQLIVPVSTDVKISWNGATARTAAKVMQGVNFEQTVKNLEELIAVRDQHFIQTNYYCRITLQLTFMQNNMHELADIIKLAARLGVDRVKGHHLWDHFTEITNLSFRKDAESIAQWNQYVKQACEAQEKYLRTDGKKVVLENIIPLQEQQAHEVPQAYECPFLNRELWISATGKISPCCAPDELRNSLGDFGNFQDQTLEQVIQSDVYQRLVKNYKELPLCKTCTMRKPA